MTQPQLLLHHYPNSPFAEKIRLIMGYKGLAWTSVMQPATMPKADLVALTGGYRRIPVLEVGQDLVCDTALIADVLEHLQPNPSLYPKPIGGLARVVAQWADSQLFSAGMACNFSPAGAAYFFRDTPPEAAKVFAEDRKAMRGGGNRTLPGDATAAYKSYLRRIASMLAGQDFLLGSHPCIADFSVYHTLWFTRSLIHPLASIFDATPVVLAWMDRMAAFGHGTVGQSNSADSVANKNRQSCTSAMFGDHDAFVDDHGIALGTAVSIKAESFGLEETVGTLVASTRTRLCISRTDERAGELRVHFPKVGFVMKAIG